jgi:hypothetical protein
MRAHPSRWLLATFGAWIGCAAPAPAPSVLPAGIAELVLPSDAATLSRLAIDEEATGRIERRRVVLAGLNRQLLMPPPDGALVPELFDFVTALAPRMESGTISPAWGSYLYTTYQRDLRAERPDGRPRRSSADVSAALERSVEFYRIRANPRVTRPSMEGQGFEATQEWRTERRLGR